MRKIKITKLGQGGEVRSHYPIEDRQIDKVSICLNTHCLPISSPYLFNFRPHHDIPSTPRGGHRIFPGGGRNMNWSKIVRPYRVKMQKVESQGGLRRPTPPAPRIRHSPPPSSNFAGGISKEVSPTLIPLPSPLPHQGRI